MKRGRGRDFAFALVKEVRLARSARGISHPVIAALDVIPQCMSFRNASSFDSLKGRTERDQ